MKAVFILFFASRTVFFGINPIAVALFYLTYYKKKQKNKEIIAIVCGVLSAALFGGTAFSLYDAARYLVIFGCISFIDRIALFYRVYLSKGQLLVVSAVTTSVISIAGELLAVKEMIIISVCEGVLVVVFAKLLEKAVNIFLSPRKIMICSNEQMISYILLLVIAAGAMFEPLPDKVSLSESMLYLIIIYMAQKYGAAAGAISGAAAGVFCGIRRDEAAFIGLFCLIGISVGMVHKMGKWASLMMYILSGVAVAMIYPSGLWKVFVLKSFAAAAFAYMIIPKSFLVPDDDENFARTDNSLVRYNMKKQISEKLSEFAEAFEKLSISFSGKNAVRSYFSGNDKEIMFNDITEAVCKNCAQCSLCWQSHYYDTYHDTIGIISLGNSGRIHPADIPSKFAMRCIHVDDFMREVNKQLEIARINLSWINRFNRNRVLMANQMKEISSLIGRLESDLNDTTYISMECEEEIIASLRRMGIRVKDIAAMKRADDNIDIIIKMRATGHHCVTYREIAEMISTIQGEKWIVEEKYGNTLPNEYKNVVFVKDVKYRILTGVARVAKEGEDISGDNYSFIRLSGGKVIMTITDGMGSGPSAYEESERAIELLEQFVQAGFNEEMALRLINSSLLLENDHDDFSTVDICVIDLYKAVCRFIKCGAPATFIRKKDYVKVITTETMPVGLLPEISTTQSIHRLGVGDFIIMLSDGITDSFISNSDDDICELIKGIKTDNPQELAERILSEVLNNSMHHAKDDMSVLVAGIWAKNL